MKTISKKFVVSLLALTLVFAMFTGISTAALPDSDTITAFGQDWEILEDEVYGAYESLSECVEDLEPEDCDEVEMDDSVWSFQLEVGPDWWYASSYYFTHDGPDKNNFATITPQPFANYKQPNDPDYEAIVAKRMQNYASSVALDNAGERLALTLRGPWTSCNGQAKFVFKAPKSGYVVLFNEDLIRGATKDTVFSSFSDPKGSGYVELCLKKNDTIISEVVKIACNSMTAEFPKAGTTGRFKVTEGDEIEVHLKAYDSTWENNTVFVDPVVAYTELIEDVVPSVDDEKETEPTDDKDNGKGLGWLLWVIIGVAVVLVIGAAVVIIVGKKKNAAPVEALAEEETPLENNDEEKTE